MAAAMSTAALALVAAGCGGGDDTTSETSAALTKPEFIKQADAICGEASERSQTEAEEFADENDFTLNKANEKQLEEAVTAVLVPNLNEQAEDLTALGAPEGDEEQVEAITVSLEDAAAEIEDNPGLVFGAEVLKEPSKLAEEYGLKVCGEE